MNLRSLEVPKDDEVEEKPAVLRLYSKEVSRQFSHQFSRQTSEKKDEKKKSMKQINKEKVWLLMIVYLSICPSMDLFM